jgi:hypothetical protein
MTFFDNDEDVIAVFDFDYRKMELLYTAVGCTVFGLTLLPPLWFFLVLALVPCFLTRNVSWEARCQHVAITRDGIKYVRDRHQTCWGLPCTDQGKHVLNLF